MGNQVIVRFPLFFIFRYHILSVLYFQSDINLTMNLNIRSNVVITANYINQQLRQRHVP